MKTKTERQKDLKALVRESRSWPTPRDIATEYDLSERFVRNAIERGWLETVRMDVIRIRPESWEAFVSARVTEGIYH